MKLTRLAFVAAALGLADSAGAQQKEAVGLGTLPPIAPTYRSVIAGWARFYFEGSGPIRGAVLSDPVLIRDGSGRLLHLVCLQAENLGPGAPPGPVRYAFGFAPGMFTAPRQRAGSPLSNEACDAYPLSYRPFPELSRL